MARGHLVTHSQIASYLRKKVDILQRCGDDPCNQLGEHRYNGVVSPTVIFGASGIGKTEGIRDLAKQLNILYFEFRLNEVNQLDLAGLPYVTDDKNGKKMTSYAPTASLPRTKPNEVSVLVFDEITTASEGSRSVALRLLDSSRAVGTEYKLPEKCICIAMGNDAEDGGANYTGLEPAFLSRCAVYRLEPNAVEWLKWADRSDIHPSVTAFIRHDREMIYVPPADTAEEPMIGASPRIWAQTSNSLQQAEGGYFGEKPTPIDDDLELESAVGFLRNDVSDKFSAFYRLQARMIPPEEILKGKSRPLKREDSTHDATFLTVEYCIKMLKDKYGSTGSLSAGATKEALNYIEWLRSLRAVGGSEVCAQAYETLLNWPPMLRLIQNPAFFKEHPEIFKEMSSTTAAIIQRN